LLIAMLEVYLMREFGLSSHRPSELYLISRHPLGKVGWTIVCNPAWGMGCALKFPTLTSAPAEILMPIQGVSSNEGDGKFVHVTNSRAPAATSNLQGTRKSCKPFLGQHLLGVCMNVYRSVACAACGNSLVPRCGGIGSRMSGCVSECHVVVVASED
jgi:hypothetical protein